MRKISARLAFILLLTLTATGCADDTVEVHGTVTLQGKPVTLGSVSLAPVADSGTTGPGAVVPITNGEFHVTGKLRMKPGKYTVRINPPPLASMGSKDPDGNLPAGVMVFQNYQTQIEVKEGVPLTIDIPANGPSSPSPSRRREKE